MSLFVANWKMNMPFDAACAFVLDNHTKLTAIPARYGIQLVICASFPALYPLAQLLATTSIAVGAQDCSAYARGSYTGEVDAVSLAQAGCTYSIVGHSERRRYHYETSELVWHKAYQLIVHKIQPIVCIGETTREANARVTCGILKQQMDAHAAIAATETLNSALWLAGKSLCIAYEPVWSIGTGIIPSYKQLCYVFDWLADYVKHYMPTTQIQLLYGGSVDSHTITELSNIPHLNGYLIGGASLEFTKLLKLVSLTKM